MNHDHSGQWGAIAGLFGYVGGLFLEIIPTASHFFQSVFTACACAAAGYITTEIFKGYIKPKFVRFIHNIKRSKK